MAKRNTSIHINGKQYDALSGALLGAQQSAESVKKVTAPIKAQVKSTRSIDGVVGGAPKHEPLAPVKQATKTTATTHPTPKPKAVSKHRSAAPHAQVTRAKQSSTLMRHAVKKPKASVKRLAKAQTATHHSVHVIKTSHVGIIPKTSVHGVNPARAARAAEHQLSPRISHFAQEMNVVANAVKDDIQRTVSAIDKAVVIPQTYTPSGAYRPDIRRVRVKAAQAEATSDVFEQALLRATSHEEETPVLTKGRMRSLRRRMVSFSAGAVAVLAIVGFFGYQQQDALQFRVAARSAGFSATMPGYQPQGFAISSVKKTGGTLYVQYASANNNYLLSQKPSQLTSQELLQRLANSRSLNTFSTVPANGRVVYIYGNNQAAWVHNGLLYQVIGNGALSTQDFTQIASSM